MTPSPPSALLLAVAFVVPLAISLFLTALLIPLAPRLGLIDLPSDRKVHTTPTPRGGGLGFCLAVLIVAGFFVILDPGYSSFLWLVLLALPVALLGLADDLRPLPWQLRLTTQLVIATLAVPIVVPTASGWWWPIAVLWVVGLTNAFNMLDNMDALSASVAWLTAAAVGAALVLGQSGASLAPAVPWLALMGGLSGFLWFNRPRARIFMGDVGSNFLGFVLGFGSLQAGLPAKGPPWAWLVPLCLCATPCYDLLSVTLLRLSQGRSPFQADKQHLSHRLVGRGLSPILAVGVIDLYTMASGAAGLLLYAVESWVAALVVVGQLAIWWGALAVAEFAASSNGPAGRKGDGH
jgi:UDP-GlcNAc:undecaprenyl-phosphate GlcNAc-1-phosphate transferase